MESLETARPNHPTDTPSRLLNTAANYVGFLSSLVVQVFLVPVYVHLLGAESYGIIGFFMSLQSVLQIMDLGFGMALNRELARRATNPDIGNSTRSLVRTLEVVSWSIGSVLGLSVALLAEFLSTHWLTGSSLTQPEVAKAVQLMGLALALQWPHSIYNGGLVGLQRQVRAALVTTSNNLVFATGAIVLLSIYPSTTTYFLWRALVSFAMVFTERTILWRLLGTRGAQFHLNSLSIIWKFSIGMAGISLTGIALVQLDKLVASRYLSLEQFGAYMIGSTASAIIPQLVSPIFVATLPSLAQAFAKDDLGALRSAFHTESQLLATLIGPVAIAVMLFAEGLLSVWTGNPQLSQQVAPLLALLAGGALLNSIMVPIYSVQLAAGWTQIAVRTNVVLILVMIPFGIFACSRFGATGAALTWPVLNAIYLVIGAWSTLGRLPPTTGWTWLTRDVLRPLLIALAIVGGIRVLIPVPSSSLLLLFHVAGVVSLAIVIGIAANRQLREKALAVWSRKRGHAPLT